MAISTVVPGMPGRSRWQQTLDLVFPPRCVGCKRVGAWICSKCWPRVGWLDDEACIRCGGSVTVPGVCPQCRWEAVGRFGSQPIVPHAVAAHVGVARQAIHELKYTTHTEIASVLGGLMANRLPDLGDIMVVPVPLHWSRKRQRGFNQSQLLARVIAKRRGLRFDSNSLVRRRRTEDQVNLGPEERIANVKGAFEWRGGSRAHLVLLVDDVYTTGSTLNACASAIRAAGGAVAGGCVFAVAPGGRRNLEIEG